MKKKLIAIIVVAVVIVGAVLVKIQMDNAAVKKRNAQVEEVAKTYYEKFLYDTLTVGKSEDEIKTLLSEYQKDGLRISIENIEKVSEIDVSKEVEAMKGNCDKKAESIKIYPQSPYGKEDYKITAMCKGDLK